MRRALPMMLAILALMIPIEAAAAELGGGAAGNARGVAPLGNPNAMSMAAAPVTMPTAALTMPAVAPQRGRGGPPPQVAQGRGRGSKVGKGNGRGRGNSGRSVRRAYRPRVVSPRRAPTYYRAPYPYRDIRRTYTRRSGLSFSVLYSGDWGGIHVEFGRPVPQTVYVVPAPVAYPVYYEEPRSIRIPPGHLPPPGWCRVWYPGTPPGHQPPPTDCDTAYYYAPPEAFIVYGGDR